MVDSDLNGASPQFTLTCISTGGPATTVTWTRNSELVTQGAKTPLVDNSTARYIHSLIITIGGESDALCLIQSHLVLPLALLLKVYIMCINLS